MIPVIKEAIQKELVDAWFLEWEQLEQRIHGAHDTRDGSAKALMEEGIELFEKLIKEASNVKKVEFTNTYEVMPINGMERLQFIKTKPGQYACYRQLDELFKETKKRCARLRLK